MLSLLAGCLSGLAILEGIGGSGSFAGRLGALLNAFCDLLLQMVTDPFRMSILILCLAMGGMVEVMNASGGFSALGGRLMRGVNTPRCAQMMAGALGLILFFDDYANALVIGPVMRDITDRQRISREKLAYLVDSTAAPVAGIAVISSWIAAELSAIESGFEIAGIEGSAYTHFLKSIPFCFYNFAALAFVFAIAWMGRDFGPMLRAERRAREATPPPAGKEMPENPARAGSIWSVILPVLTLILYVFVDFYMDGMQKAAAAGAETEGFSLAGISAAFSYADTVLILMRASILASFIAVPLSCLTGGRGAAQAVGDWVRGAAGILLTVVILILAWGLSSVLEELGAVYYLVEMVTLHLPGWLVPALVFTVCCVISFGAGSFGCMVIVMPIVVPIAYQAAEGGGEQLIFASIAAVLSGSIFGDHCSPVTDTTILSSVGAGCDNLAHVKTQMPYALSAAAVSLVFGYLPAGLGVSPALLLPAAVLAPAGVLYVWGRRPEKIENQNEQERRRI